MLLNNGEHPFIGKGEGKKEFIEKIKKQPNLVFINKVSE